MCENMFILFKYDISGRDNCWIYKSRKTWLTWMRHTARDESCEIYITSGFLTSDVLLQVSFSLYIHPSLLCALVYRNFYPTLPHSILRHVSHTTITILSSLSTYIFTLYAAKSKRRGRTRRRIRGS